MTTPDRRPEFTEILASMQAGDENAYDALLPIVYEELRALARSRMLTERDEHTLQPTALIHEAWLRLVGSPPGELRGRAHFFGAAAEAMQRVLVDHARRRAAQKRRADGARVTLADVVDGSSDDSDALDVLALDEALDQLAGVDARVAQVVRMRYFAGFSVSETASALEVSEPTVKRDFAYGKAWLADHLTAGG